MSAVINVCFHGIGTPQRELEPGEAPYWTDVDTFHRILDLVREDPRVRLSFDDGNVSDVQIALPALVERNLHATFFVLAGRLGLAGSLSPDGLRQLVEQGMAIGSHGMDHRPWRRLSDDAAGRELVEARELLEEAIAAPVVDAALPLGCYDRRTLGRLRRLGYSSVKTSDRLWAREGAWLQPRYSIMSGDTPESFAGSVLRRPSAVRRARGLGVGLVKRLR